MAETSAERDALEVVPCNAEGIDHPPHVIDFSGIDSSFRVLGPWQCPGWSEPSNPPAHGCANYAAPVTCLTAPSSVTGRCDHCKEQA